MQIVAALCISERAREVFHLAGVGPDLMPDEHMQVLAGWALTGAKDIPPAVWAVLSAEPPGSMSYAASLMMRLEMLTDGVLGDPEWPLRDVRRHVAAEVARWSPRVLRWAAAEIERHGAAAMPDVGREMGAVLALLEAVRQADAEGVAA